MNGDRDDTPALGSGVKGFAFLQSTGGLALVVLLLFAAGLLRLVLVERSDSTLLAADAAGLARCLPPLELPALGVVTVLPAPTGTQALLTLHTLGPVPVQDQLAGTLPAEGQTVPLAGRHLTLRKTSADFQLRVPDKVTLLVRYAGSTMRLPATSRLAPSPELTYEVEVPKDATLVATVKGAGAQAQALIAADQDVGPVTIDAGLSAVSSQSLSLQRVVDELPQDLSGTRASGHPGLAELAIDVGALRRRTDAATPSFVACAARIVSGPSTDWKRVSVDAAAGAGGTPDRLDLVLPESLRPKLLEWAMPLRIAVATLDGKAIAVGSMALVGRAGAAGAATLATALLFGIVMYQHGTRRRARLLTQDARWLSGLFLGTDGQPSLSLLQVFLWTVVTAWGMAYVYVASGQLLSLTPEVMALLALAGTGSVLARWIGASGTGTGNTPETKATVAQDAGNQAPMDNEFFRMLSSNGEFDLMKLQLFIFTVLIAMYVVSRIIDAAAFPALDPNMLMLMGISQGVYVTSKWSAATPLAKAQSLTLEVAAQTAVLEQLKVQPAKPEDLKAATDKLSVLQADCDKALAVLGLKRL